MSSVHTASVWGKNDILNVSPRFSIQKWEGCGWYGVF